MITATVPDGYELYVHADKILQTVNRNQVQVSGAQYWKNKQSGAAANTSDTSTDTVLNTDTVQVTPNYVTVVATDNDGTKITKTMGCSRPNAHLSSLNADRTLCLGHNLAGEVTISLNYMEDILDVDGIRVYAYQTNEYVTSVMQLMNNAWTNVQYDTNWVSGTINAQFDGVFQLAIPYNSGWQAYVDGKEVEVFQSGVRYMGILLSEGEHEIRFKYTTPGITTGTVLSIAALMVAFVYWMYECGLLNRMNNQARSRKRWTKVEKHNNAAKWHDVK